MWQEMGKSLNHQESNICLENHTHNPKCMWGILHFRQNRWHSVKKKLPRKKHGSSKHSYDQESIRSTPESTEMHENIDSPVENSAVETKAMVVSGSTHKSSMKSRIKALIAEEMSKRKARHRRSTSYPTRPPLDATNSVHRSDTESTTETKSNDDVLVSHHRLKPTALLDPVLPKVGEEHESSCELCAAMLNVNYLTQSEVHKLGRQPVRDHTVLHDKLIYAIEPHKCASLQESKLFMDALDLLNMRKELFLKILKDPSSSLANQLNCRRMPNLRFGLTKSVSFPASRSSKTGFSPENSITKQGNGCPRIDGVQGCIEGTEGLRDIEFSDKMLRKRHDSKVALKRFKNLREKIKHVIRDRKKEKNRIIMDAVHHKIPYGQSVQEIKDDKFCKSSLQRFKRTSSYNESFDKYSRLLEIVANREEKDHSSGRLRFKTGDTTPSSVSKSPALGRMFSLPDLRSYSYHTDESCSSSVMNTPDVGFTGEKRLSQEKLLEVGEAYEDSAYLKTVESGSSHDLNVENEQISDPQTLKSDDVSEDDSSDESEIGKRVVQSVLEDSKLAQNLIFPTEHDSSSIKHNLVSENTINIETLETQARQFYIDTKNKSEFNYVKDVLELSGFSRDEILGKWHSAEHPLDPLVFEEVEGCSVSQPEYSGNGEGGQSYDHLLLFDLINEVLLEIYEKSFCYWPMPLTNRSHIHQMPKGQHVLETVWAEISRFLSFKPEIDQGFDDAVNRDLGKNDGWMNLQLDGECVGLEVEDLIFDDLLEEIISSRH